MLFFPPLKDRLSDRSAYRGRLGCFSSLCIFSAAAITAPWWTLRFLIGQVEDGLNAAADVHEPESYVMDITIKHIRREIGLKWEESYRREVVKDYDG